MAPAPRDPTTQADTPPSYPYWRLSAFYLFFFATLGALIPYWGLYLQSLGFAPREIGELMAVLMATKILSPNIWAWLADSVYFGGSWTRLRIVRLASLLALLAFSGVFAVSGFWWLALVMALFSFFWNAALPQFEAITLTHLGEHVHGYTRVRLWGSVGFIFAVVALGRLVEMYGSRALPTTVLVLIGGIWLSSLAVTERVTEPDRRPQASLRRVLGKPSVLALLGACLLMQASHGPYYVFFTIHLRGHGYSESAIGQLWALGVVAEVVLFAVMTCLFRRFRARALFLSCFVLTGVRWVLVGRYPDSIGLMVVAQLLHAASFGVYHAVAIQLIHGLFVGRHQGRGQALYSSMSFGAGGAIGALASGYLWTAWGPTLTWYTAAAVSALGFLMVWRWMAPDEAEQPVVEARHHS